MEQAGGGFLFLHNVAELPKWMQAKLFQAIQSGSFCHLGGNQPIALTARIAASTSEDLATLAAAGKFFHELFYYLHVVPVHVPALRNRREDVAPLADQFLQESLRLRPPGKAAHPLAFAKDAHRALESYNWPGNVYELSNLVRRAVVFASGAEINAADMADLFPPPAATDAVETITIPYAGDLRIIERSIVSEVINRYNGNKSAAARALGLHRKTLYRILEDERHSERIRSSASWPSAKASRSPLAEVAPPKSTRLSADARRRLLAALPPNRLGRSGPRSCSIPTGTGWARI